MPRVVGQYGCVVAFYEVNQEFDWMANTYRGRPVLIDGVLWPTTEHYFQAMKFPGLNAKETAYRQAILNYQDSFKQFPAFARNTALHLQLHFDRGAWDGTPGHLNGLSHQVMRKAIRTKLDAHLDLKLQLVALQDDAIIVEATENDKKWADGGDGSGTNHLGILYMELLAEYKSKLSKAHAQSAAYLRYQAFNTYRLGQFGKKSLYDPCFASTANAHASHEDKIEENAKRHLMDTFSHMGLAKIDILPDKNIPQQFVYQFTFATSQQAHSFATSAGAAPREFSTVTLGPKRAEITFNKAGVSEAALELLFDEACKAVKPKGAKEKLQLVECLKTLKQKSLDAFRAKKLDFQSVSTIGQSALRLAQQVGKDSLSPKDIRDFEKKTQAFKTSWTWKVILGAVVGAAIGILLGVMLGALAGPAGAFLALAAGAKGAAIGASLGAGFGALGGGFCFWQRKTADPINAVVETARSLQVKVH